MLSAVYRLVYRFDSERELFQTMTMLNELERRAQWLPFVKIQFDSPEKEEKVCAALGLITGQLVVDSHYDQLLQALLASTEYSQETSRLNRCKKQHWVVGGGGGMTPSEFF
jgi:hypothetical protein